MAIKFTGQLSLKDDIAAAAGDTVAPYNVSDYAGYSEGIPTTGRLGLRRFYGQPKKSSWTHGSTKHDGIASTAVTSETLGLSAPIHQISGNSGSSTTWETVNLDGKLTNFVGQTGRLVFHYRSGTSYTGDIQIAGVSVGGNTYDFSTDYTQWQTTTPSTVFANNPENYNARGWYTVSTVTSAYGRFIRRSGGTPSGSTGVATAPPNNTYYIYYEASSSGYSNKGSWLRSPEITLSSDTLSFYLARYGATVGTLSVFWDHTG